MDHSIRGSQRATVRLVKKKWDQLFAIAALNGRFWPISATICPKTNIQSRRLASKIIASFP
jgi:hypothetical protein